MKIKAFFDETSAPRSYSYSAISKDVFGHNYGRTDNVIFRGRFATAISYAIKNSFINAFHL